MHMLRALALVCAIALCCSCSHAQDGAVILPTDDEIRLVLTEGKRAIALYKITIDVEEKVFGNDGMDAVAKDRELASHLEIALEGFEKRPQEFNSPLGFKFFAWLEDASRNTLLCSSKLMDDSLTSLRAGAKDKAGFDMQASLACLEISTLMYTASEKVGALYTRYVEGQEQLAEAATRVAQDCANALKQKCASSKP
jgi:hypothetical protein